MKKHLGLFISIFLAMISIGGALFVLGGKNLIPTISKKQVCALEEISTNSLSPNIIEQDNILARANVKPIISYKETSQNVYEFTITNTDDIGAGVTYIWRKRAVDSNSWGTFHEGTDTSATLTFDAHYDIVVIYETSPGVYIESNFITKYRKCLVKFNLDNETTYSQQNNVELFATKPTINPKKDGYIFSGWYQNEEGIGDPWNFENDHIIRDTILYAQWTNLECENEETLNQYINQPIPIKFKINVQDEVEWYVDNKKYDSTETTFEYSPQTIGTYSVYCVVQGVKSKEIQFVVSYYEPEEIKIVSERSSRTSYTLSIRHEYLSSIDISKFAWYRGNELIAEGTYECFLTVSADYEVYAVYKKNNNEIIKSNTIKVTPSGDILNIPLILSITAFALLGIFLLVFIRKKYLRYKNRKYATIFTWHKW